MAKNRDIMLLRVTLNCTSENRILRLYGFTQNPFPQVAKAELAGAMQQLNSLAGHPLSGSEDIAKRLEGWSEEFISLCQRNYRPGEWVTFQVQFPAGDAL